MTDVLDGTVLVRSVGTVDIWVVEYMIFSYAAPSPGGKEIQSLGFGSAPDTVGNPCVGMPVMFRTCGVMAGSLASNASPGLFGMGGLTRL